MSLYKFIIYVSHIYLKFIDKFLMFGFNFIIGLNLLTYTKLMGIGRCIKDYFLLQYFLLIYQQKVNTNNRYLEALLKTSKLL